MKVLNPVTIFSWGVKPITESWYDKKVGKVGKAGKVEKVKKVGKVGKVGKIGNEGKKLSNQKFVLLYLNIYKHYFKFICYLLLNVIYNENIYNSYCQKYIYNNNKIGCYRRHFFNCWYFFDFWLFSNQKVFHFWMGHINFWFVCYRLLFPPNEPNEPNERNEKPSIPQNKPNEPNEPNERNEKPSIPPNEPNERNETNEFFRKNLISPNEPNDHQMKAITFGIGLSTIPSPCEKSFFLRSRSNFLSKRSNLKKLFFSISFKSLCLMFESKCLSRNSSSNIKKIKKVY